MTGIAEASLIGTVFDKLGRDRTNEEIAQFLSGSTEGEMGNIRRYKRATFWTGARTATQWASATTEVKWYWDATNEFIGIECRVRREKTIKIESRMCGQIIRGLRGQVNDFTLTDFWIKKIKGKFMTSPRGSGSLGGSAITSCEVVALRVSRTGVLFTVLVSTYRPAE